MRRRIATRRSSSFRVLACEMLESRRLLAIDATLGLSANQDASAASATSNTAPAIGFQLLHSLGANPDDGDAPMRAPLVAVGSKLYGMTNEGGTNNEGAVFSVNDDGSNFQVLHSFTWTSTAPLDGALPGLSSGLTVIGSTLFGTTEQGGIANNGALFSMNLDGSGFQILHSFMGGTNDGATPDAAPILVGSVLYGTTRSGGSAGDGTVYSINTDGSNYQIVHTFLGGASDGATPYTELTQVGSLLYGTTTAGGSANLGTAFSMNLDGSNFQVLYSFSSNGFYGPSSQLIVVGAEMYGVSVPGGTSGQRDGICRESEWLELSDFAQLHGYGRRRCLSRIESDSDRLDSLWDDRLRRRRRRRHGLLDQHRRLELPGAPLPVDFGRRRCLRQRHRGRFDSVRTWIGRRHVTAAGLCFRSVPTAQTFKSSTTFLATDRNLAQLLSQTAQRSLEPRRTELTGTGRHCSPSMTMARTLASCTLSRPARERLRSGRWS